MSVKPLYALAIAAVFGCAHGSNASADVPPLPTLRKAVVISSDEIETAHADVGTVYDAVSRLRPNWRYAMVLVDGQQQRGGIDILRSIPASEVADIRYYDITEAGATFGLKTTGGVVDVRMKVRD
jgi:hypothetical protein